jgi:hypothetical protein
MHTYIHVHVHVAGLLIQRLRKTLSAGLGHTYIHTHTYMYMCRIAGLEAPEDFKRMARTHLDDLLALDWPEERQMREYPVTRSGDLTMMPFIAHV